MPSVTEVLLTLLGVLDKAVECLCDKQQSYPLSGIELSCRSISTRVDEELVFNSNVDRYGADSQPCYCAEPNCTGFIGGKAQTERATKLPLATTEALGIDDGDKWDTAVAKKPRKKKASKDDEGYVNSVQPRLISEDGVNKVMATLMQCKELEGWR
ncbi:hypothetical protein QBC39DRAFT_415596 [Podospora conica]|nr:hypothetical protein QBC39DRAFT_415596 [Schizothecium conicum]